MSFSYSIRGLQEFENAVRRFPQYVVQRGNLFIVRSLAEYRRVIMRDPWRVGGSGGGAPVKTGNLRDTHNQTVADLIGRIYPTASYAPYIHGIEGYARRRTYQLRPWLSYAFDTAAPAVAQHEKEMFDDIIAQLAS